MHSHHSNTPYNLHSNLTTFTFLVHIIAVLILKPPLRVSRDAEGLAKGQLAELRFWNSIIKVPYQSNCQNFFKFYCHFLGRRARGAFSVPLAFAKKFWSFAHWM